MNENACDLIFHTIIVLALTAGVLGGIYGATQHALNEDRKIAEMVANGADPIASACVYRSAPYNVCLANEILRHD